MQRAALCTNRWRQGPGRLGRHPTRPVHSGTCALAYMYRLTASENRTHRLMNDRPPCRITCTGPERQQRGQSPAVLELLCRACKMRPRLAPQCLTKTNHMPANNLEPAPTIRRSAVGRSLWCQERSTYYYNYLPTVQ